MYINLGKIGLQNTTEDTNDWIIVSQVVESGMSYEKPQLVRTVEELDIWFGRNFESYNYLKELILSDVTLYLYKPISTNSKSSETVDLSRYSSSQYQTYIAETDIDWIEKLKNNPGNYKFRVLTENGSITLSGNDKEFKCDWYIINDSEVEKITTDLNNYESLDIILNDWDSEINPDKFELSTKQLLLDILPDKKLINVHGYDTTWIWWKDEDDYYSLVDTDNLNQNLDLTSESLNNRDTLLLTTPETKHIDYLYPEYLTGETRLGIFSSNDGKTASTSNLDTNKLNKGYQSFKYQIKLTKTTLDVGYIIIPTANDDRYLVVSNSLSEENYPNLNYYNNMITIGDFAGLKTKCEELFSVTGSNPFFITSTKVIPNLQFQTFENIEVTPLIKESNRILYNTLLKLRNQDPNKKENICAEFWSKTIGRSSDLDDDLIHITIEDTNQSGYYRIIISRYEYSETYEGTVRSKFSEERLDYKISKNSKLVYCHFTGENLRLGNFVLRGAEMETYTADNYKEALKPMTAIQGIPVHPDFLLIPDPFKFIPNKYNPITDNGVKYYKEYEYILETAKELNCQVLITNFEYPEKILHVSDFPNSTEAEIGVVYEHEGIYKRKSNLDLINLTGIDKEIAAANGDYIYNYPNDSDNYLLYFYKPMYIYGDERPGYYLFLREILTNEISISEKDILYDSVLGDKPYEKQEIEENLEKHKSNYLVCNNQIYYYKKYFSGLNYNTSLWVRFVLGKITRELEKNRGNIISSKFLGKTRKTILELLDNIKSFSIVQNISLTSFEYYPNYNALILSIDVYVNELVNNNIKLDITINYNTY